MTAFGGSLRRTVSPIRFRTRRRKKAEGEGQGRDSNRHERTTDELHKKEKDAGVSADEMKRILAELQKLHDRYILQAEEVGQAKEREILER